jgi:hypothetical protein
MPLCSIDAVAIPPCGQIQGLAREAIVGHDQLVAYQRAQPIAARADQTVWPAGWEDLREFRALHATTPGTALAHLSVPGTGRYGLWLAGSFTRGFDVGVDGRGSGSVENELSGWDHLTDLSLTAGPHTFSLTYPHPDLTPGSGDNTGTYLSAIALEPQSPPSELIVVSPRQATRLCGRPLNWIELVLTYPGARPTVRR